MKRMLPAWIFACFLYACSPPHRISSVARKTLHAGALAYAHTGVCLYEPAARKYWYRHQADKYFIPASNVKIATCYAALKYLGDSLKSLNYQEQENAIIIEGTGDPTLLHPDFTYQPAFELLRRKQHILINTENWKTTALGRGWAWDDYNDAYMTERSPLPLYGNMIRVTKINTNTVSTGSDTTGMLNRKNILAYPAFFGDSIFMEEEGSVSADYFSLRRSPASNMLRIIPSGHHFTGQSIPFLTYGFETGRKLLRDTLKKGIRASYYVLQHPKTLFSQPVDSVVIPMMHHSDNFFAEQLLLMTSNELLGIMNEEHIIDKLLKTDLKELPQKPRWVDGSGLSRYNLFTPMDFVFILDKIKNEFDWERIQKIFPTGNQGSLQGYYRADSGFIFAKTGSMSGVVSLSGYLYTKKNKLLLFSLLVNNHQAPAADVRRRLEEFLQKIRRKF